MNHIHSPFFLTFLLLALLPHQVLSSIQKPMSSATPAAPVSNPTTSTSNPGAADTTVSNYKYETRGRRDPFRTLDVTNTVQATAAPLVRPAGPKGQLVSEIKLVGIIKSKDGIMAVTEGYRGRTFFIHPGDDLYDGKVLEIRSDSLLLSQILTDSFGKKISQQVVKKLHPTRGEGTNEK